MRMTRINIHTHNMRAFTYTHTQFSVVIKTA